MAMEISQSGTLIGAVLESTGYMVQAHILDKLAPLSDDGTIGGMFIAAAAFIFVFGCIVGMMQYLFRGSFQLVRWMLIGPVLFYLAVGLRTEVDYSRWSFPGDDDSKNQEEVKKRVAEVWGDKTPKVSSVFAEYNKMVTIVMREVANEIAGSIPKIDDKFIKRTEIISDMQNAVLPDPGARLFFGNTLMRGCKEYFQTANKAFLNEAGTIIDQKKQAEAELGEIGQSPTTFFYEDNPARASQIKYLARKMALYGPEFLTVGEEGNVQIGNVQLLLRNIKSETRYDDDGSLYLKSPDLLTVSKMEKNLKNSKFTCEQLWQVGYLVLYIEAFEEWGRKMEINKDDLDSKEGINDAENLWMVDLFVALEMQRETVDARVNPQPKKVRTNEELIDHLTKNPEEFYGLIARYLLRNSIYDGGALSNFLADHIVSSSKETLAFSGFRDSSLRGEKIRLLRTQFSSRNKTLTIALQMPYYQAVLLFFLSVLYPFFALLLLFPGKHKVMIYWFMLWLWAKSWEVGFAMVMLLDELLFKLMSVGMTRMDMSENAVGETFNIDNALSPDLYVNMMSLKYVNPSISLTNYYVIIGVALGSIPIISSILIIGLNDALSGLLAGQMDKYADSTHVEMGTRQHGTYTTRLNALERMQNDQEDAFMKNVLDPAKSSVGAGAAAAGFNSGSGSGGFGQMLAGDGQSSSGEGSNSTPQTQEVAGGGSNNTPQTPEVGSDAWINAQVQQGKEKLALANLAQDAQDATKGTENTEKS